MTSRSTDYRNRKKLADIEANLLAANQPFGSSFRSNVSSTSTSVESCVQSTSTHREYDQHNDIPMLPHEDDLDDNMDIDSDRELPQTNSMTNVDEIISNLLINYQITTKTSDSSMEKLLKLVNQCAKLKGLENDLVPDSYYELTKNSSVNPPGIRFICKNENCNKLTKLIYRRISKSYDKVQCECGQTIDPIEETYGPRGYFVKLDPINRIRQMLENSFIRNKIKFCNEDAFNQTVTYGKFNSGRIYRKTMQNGDLSLTFFADGVKVFGSSSSDFWPALLSINELPSSLRKEFVIPAVIYFGRKKPSGAHMMECVREDLAEMATEGINWSLENASDGSFEMHLANTKVKTIFGVFDSQAKPAFLNMQYPSGLKSCPLCYIEAVKVDHNIIFEYSHNLQLRTIDHYPTLLKEMVDEEGPLVEHRGIYGLPLMSAIPYYDSIKSTTVDFMHAVDLGTTNRIVSEWFKSKNHRCEFYISGKSKDELNQTMKSIKPPDHLPRTIRPLSDLVNYKASEWNSFLLYIFPVVMKKFLVSKFYDHFFYLSFSLATLLKSSISPSELCLVNRVLKKFVSQLEGLYNRKQLTHNSHLLLHLTEVVKDVGSLADVNGYIFEDMNGRLRSFVHGSNNVAKQIANKSELQFLSRMSLTKIDSANATTTAITKPILKYRKNIDFNFSTLVKNQFNLYLKHQFATLYYKNVTYTSKSYNREKKSCNSVVLLKNRNFFSIYCFIEVSEEKFAIGEEKVSIGNVSNEFDDNFGKCSLVLPYIHIVQNLSSSVIVNIKDIEEKCLYIELDDKQYCILINNRYAF